MVVAYRYVINIDQLIPYCAVQVPSGGIDHFLYYSIGDTLATYCKQYKVRDKIQQLHVCNS